MKGAKELDDWGLRILRGLYLMRHEEADRRNRAPYRIANDSVLVTIARQRATKPGPGIPERFFKRYAKRIGGLVRSSKDQPPLPKPKRERTRAEPDSAADQGAVREAAQVATRCGRGARRRGLGRVPQRAAAARGASDPERPRTAGRTARTVPRPRVRRGDAGGDTCMTPNWDENIP